MEDEMGPSSLAMGATGQSTLAGAMEVDSDLQEKQVKPQSNGLNNSVQKVLISNDIIEPNGIYEEKPVEFDANDDYVELLGKEVHDRSLQVDNMLNFRTGYVYNPAMMFHAHPESDFTEGADSNGAVHPEVPERISRIYQVLKQNGCVKRMKLIKIREAIMEEVMLVHRKELWLGIEQLESFRLSTTIEMSRLLEKDSLYVNQYTARSARLSCGGVMELCDAVASGKVKNGFAIVRPPGHHAEPQSAMGFCIYNNVAVAARFLQEKYGKAEDETRCERILIVDWDVHHGNGTQSTFYDDPNVLFISLHRHDGKFYPGGTAGGYDQDGSDNAKGKNINIPWPTAGMEDGDYIAAFQRIVMPVAIEFSPDIVLVSAGFDAADGDELGECFVTPAGYGHMTHMLSSLAEGRVVVALEGGYNLEAISNSALHVTEVLLGDPPQDLNPGTSCGYVADQTLNLVKRTHAPYWKSLGVVNHEAAGNEDENLSSFSLAQAIASHRAYEMTKKFVLTVWPISSDHGFNGQILCSPSILTDEVILLFAHDMGNIRWDLRGTMTVDPQAHLMKIVESSSEVVEWAQKKQIGLLDLCIISEHPNRLPPPLNNRQRQFIKTNQNQQEAQKETARELVLHAWDNIVTMLMQTHAPKKVMLMGMGTACDAILNLVLERKLDGVCGVVQIPGYAPLPATSSKQETQRKWYFRNSQVYVPNDHTIFQNAEEGIVTAKRFGKLNRSEEKRAVQILKAEFNNITQYIEKQLLED